MYADGYTGKTHDEDTGNGVVIRSNLHMGETQKDQMNDLPALKYGAVCAEKLRGAPVLCRLNGSVP